MGGALLLIGRLSSTARLGLDPGGGRRQLVAKRPPAADLLRQRLRVDDVLGVGRLGPGDKFGATSLSV